MSFTQMGGEGVVRGGKQGKNNLKQQEYNDKWGKTAIEKAH